MKYFCQLFCFALLLNSLSLQAGHEVRSHGARSSALGSADVGLKDFWSIRNNQAGLAYLQKKSVGIYYENRYLVNELGFQSISFAIPLKSSVLGITADYFGDEKFNESTLGISFAKKLFPNFSMGLQLDYLTTFVDNDYFRKHNVITFELGLMYDVTEQITIGTHVFNPIESHLDNDNKEIIPATYSIGIAYMINDFILLSSEVEKVTDQKESYRVGLEYQIVKKTYLRIGVGTNPNIFSFGFETSWKNLTIQFASSRHDKLGYSPMASLMLSF